MSRNGSVSLVAALATTLILGLVAGGAHGAKVEKDRFGEEARVIAVEVPVNVVDRSGRPVRGLTQTDFEIFDDGKPQPISDFEVVDLGSAETAKLRPDDLPPNARRHFLLLFDIGFSKPASVLKARLAARQFVVERLHPADLVGVGTFSHSAGFRLILSFTSDRAQVAHAIDGLGLDRTQQIDPLKLVLEAPQTPGQDSLAQSRERTNDLSQNLRDAELEHFKLMAEELEKNERGFERSQITNFSKELSAMARALSSVSGRKQVVLFSEGFDSRLLTGDPLRPPSEGDERTQLLEQGSLWRIQGDDLYGNTELQRRLGDMVEIFRRADCTLQSVDIGGLRAGGDVLAKGPLNVGQEGLFYMANETGGTLFKDANDLGTQLDELLERNSVTYLLTFQPTINRFDGRFHRLRVKLKEKSDRDLRLSYRQGYYAPRPYEELSDFERDLLASNAIVTAAQAEEIRVDVLAAPFRATPAWAYVPVITEIDGASLIEGHASDKLDIEIYAYATDDHGEMMGFFTRQISIDLTQGRKQLLEGGVKYYGHLELKPGEYRLRVLVRNALNGRTAVRSVPLTVPTYEEQGTIVLPPFFLETPGRWLLVRERLDDARPGSTIYPFTLKGEPYVPSARPVVARGGETSLCLVAYNLGTGSISLDGEVVNALGQPVEGGLLHLVERTATGIDGYDKLLARFSSTGLEAGHYTLKVVVRDDARGFREINSIPITVQN